VPANGCTRARSLSNSLISRNSRSARSVSASSKDRSCRHCSDRRKSQAGRHGASRHRTRNNLGLDRYTKDAGCGPPCAKPKLSGRKLEGCYTVADGSPAGSRSRASVAPDVYEPAQPARRRALDSKALAPEQLASAFASLLCDRTTPAGQIICRWPLCEFERFFHGA
jgi:hypothetical protein